MSYIHLWKHGNTICMQLPRVSRLYIYIKLKIWRLPYFLPFKVILFHPPLKSFTEMSFYNNHYRSIITEWTHKEWDPSAQPSLSWSTSSSHPSPKIYHSIALPNSRRQKTKQNKEKMGNYGKRQAWSHTKGVSYNNYYYKIPTKLESKVIILCTLWTSRDQR